jgi:hypothetical protein
MEELDNNVFIKKWFCHINKTIEVKEYYIYYIDNSARRFVFTKGVTDEEIKQQILHLIKRELEEKGWVKNEPEVKEYEHNPDDPYYQNEDLYIPNEINCES